MWLCLLLVFTFVCFSYLFRPIYSLVSSSVEDSTMKSWEEALSRQCMVSET